MYSATQKIGWDIDHAGLSCWIEASEEKSISDRWKLLRDFIRIGFNFLFATIKAKI